MIIRGAYQAASEDSRWEYEPVSYLWPYIEPDSDSSDCVSSNEGSKDKSKSDYQEQKEVVLFPHRNPRKLKQDDQRSLSQLKSNIERSNDKLFFIKHMSTGLTHSKWYLLQVNIYQSEPFSMRNYGVIFADGTSDNMRTAKNMPL